MVTWITNTVARGKARSERDLHVANEVQHKDRVEPFDGTDSRVGVMMGSSGHLSCCGSASPRFAISACSRNLQRS